MGSKRDDGSWEEEREGAEDVDAGEEGSHSGQRRPVACGHEGWPDGTKAP